MARMKPPHSARDPQVEDWLRQGLALHQAGKPLAAEPFYRKVLERQPLNHAANHLLGLVVLGQGDPARAVELIATAVRHYPKEVRYHANLGVALNAADRPAQALESLDRALALDPRFAPAHSNRGMALKALGRLDEAAESYRRAIGLTPREAGFHLNLGNVLADLGDYPGAEASYRRTLALRPADAAAFAGLGRVLVALGRSADAIAAQREAMDENSAAHHQALGESLAAAGQLDDAAAHYRRALALDPQRTEPWRMLSLILHRSSADAELAEMERLTSDSAMEDAARLHVDFALGRAYADLDEHARSFAAYGRANAAARRLAPYSMDAARRNFAHLRQLFRELPTADGPAAAMPPIFIVGLPRSGKSTLEGMLARHPATHPAGESPVFPYLVSSLAREYDLAGGAGLGSVPPGTFAALGTRYMERLRKVVPEQQRGIDTMPRNFLHIGYIALALPGARIIHCRRDPLDHCMALFQKHFTRPGYGYSNDLADLAAYYRLYAGLMEHWRRLVPRIILEIDTGELRSRPGETMARVLEFCGLAWHDACAEPFLSEPRLHDPQEAPDPASALGPYAEVLSRLLFKPE